MPRSPARPCHPAVDHLTLTVEPGGELHGCRIGRMVEAFAILRTTSQNRNVKLRAFAAQIVDGASAQPPQRPPFDPPR